MQALTTQEVKIQHALNRLFLVIVKDRLRLPAKQLPDCGHFGSAIVDVHALGLGNGRL